MAQVDLKFGKELKKYGAIDFNACYNCGTCTAVCDLATAKDSFPRELVRQSVLGQPKEVITSLKPWLCYYCGECTTYCPQEAKPGELMMSLRRWLTAKYDWTGLSGVFYRNLSAYIISFLLIIAGLILFAAKLDWNQELIMHYGHYFEMFAIAGVFAVILLPNIIRMWFFTILRVEIKASFKVYVNAFSDLLLHMFTQKRILECEEDSSAKIKWFEHFILVIGYLTLLFTTVFLDWFSSKNLFIIWLGYIESAVIFVVTFLFIINRIEKKEANQKYSHPSDWFFVIWLFLMGITAFAVRLFLDINILESTFWLFMVHLMVLIQWAIIIVPFGKWTHFLYRSFAMYFEKIQELTLRPIKK